MSRARTNLGLLLCLSAAPACGIPLAADSAGPVNTCTTASDCAAGAACAPVGDGRACVATSADLPGLLLDIRPDANSPLGANVSFLIDSAAQLGRDAGGSVTRFDPKLPALASVSGKVILKGGSSYCNALGKDSSYPMAATFQPVVRFVGLQDQEGYPASPEQGDAGFSYRLKVPKGDYDIYLAAQPASCADVPPPIFVPGFHIDGDTAINITADAPRKLKGQLHVPPQLNVTDWQLDVREPKRGHVISNVMTLAQPASQSYANFELRLFWSDNGAFSPLIRLHPKDGAQGPTVYWDLAAVALQGSTDDVSLALYGLDAMPRHVEGHVLDMKGNPVTAFVRIQSAQFPSTGTAMYELNTATDGDGLYTADLPPGEYNVFAQPANDTTKAIAVTNLKLPAGQGCYCGQSIVLPDRSTLQGSVSGPAGQSMDASEVVVTQSVISSDKFLDQMLQLDPLPSPGASGWVAGGAFSLRVDPGEFDLAIQPPAGSGYPWLVRSRIAVASADTTPVSDLGALTVPYPAVLEGVIRDADGSPIAGAVRAWLPVVDTSDGGRKVNRVIQVGASQTGIDGAYVLPLPPSLSQ